MTSVVVDTDVVSFLFKNDSRAQLCLPLLKNRTLLVSFMTEAELEQWILLAKWGASRNAGIALGALPVQSPPNGNIPANPSCRHILPEPVPNVPAVRIGGLSEICLWPWHTTEPTSI